MRRGNVFTSRMSSGGEAAQRAVGPRDSCVTIFPAPRHAGGATSSFVSSPPRRTTAFLQKRTPPGHVETAFLQKHLQSAQKQKAFLQKRVPCARNRTAFLQKWKAVVQKRVPFPRARNPFPQNSAHLLDTRVPLRSNCLERGRNSAGEGSGASTPKRRQAFGIDTVSTAKYANHAKRGFLVRVFWCGSRLRAGLKIRRRSAPETGALRPGGLRRPADFLDRLLVLWPSRLKNHQPGRPVDK